MLNVYKSKVKIPNDVKATMLKFYAIFDNHRQYHEVKIETLQICDIKETSMKMSV